MKELLLVKLQDPFLYPWKCPKTEGLQSLQNLAFVKM